MKTPEQIAADVLDGLDYGSDDAERNARRAVEGFRSGWLDEGALLSLITDATRAERVQQERAQRLPDGEARFTVRFDPEVWPTLDPEEQQAWIDRVNDAINGEAYVTLTEVGR